MFWVRGSIWEDFFNSINIQYEYSLFEVGKFTDSQYATHTHTMERIFGLMVINNNLKIIGV